MTNRALAGSERKPINGARSLGKADPTERLEVTVLVRRRGADALREHAMKMLPAGNQGGKHLEREDFERQFGAEPGAVEAVKKYAAGHNLAVVQEDDARRTIVLSGTVADMNRAFGVDLERFEHEGGSYRGRTGAVMLPDELQGKVDGVFGLDDRPQAHPHFRGRMHGNVQWHATAGSFSPTQLATLYNFPAGSGKGQCIGIIELGGGYRPADLKKYFAELGIAQPKVTAVSVDHGKNQPTGDPNGPDGEVMLDIEVAGAIAPQAHLAVYFAPNTDEGFLDAITTAVHDKVNRPSIISISWGGPESSWTPQSMTAYDDAFQAAAAMGVTVCAAAGDNGSSDNAEGDNVDFPASSPYVLACGGTSLHATGDSIATETVWNDGAQGGSTGGGISSFFARPPYQEGLSATLTHGGSKPLTKRGVPDVAGDADENTGYDVRVDGVDTVIGGTSAVAPLWAGLVARINANSGHAAGYLNPILYKNPKAFRDITQGNNGDYKAAKNWDACTGLGTPIGTKIAAALPAKA